MKKLHRKELFEFENQSYLPKIVRYSVTSLLNLLHKMIGSNEVITNLIINARRRTEFDNIVDLGSGSGGPMLEVADKLKTTENLKNLNLILTDLFPNQTVIESINSRNNSNVSYYHQPVNATELSAAPKGLKTMVASFHHLNPTEAKSVLRSAQSNHQPILIYEIAKNNVPFPLWLLFLPVGMSILFLMTLVMTPFTQGLTFKQLIFTYLIPIIPIVYAWDGQSSLMRTYSFNDIKQILPKKTESYTWVIDDAYNKRNKKSGYYVMGIPEN